MEKMLPDIRISLVVSMKYLKFCSKLFQGFNKNETLHLSKRWVCGEAFVSDTKCHFSFGRRPPLIL